MKICWFKDSKIGHEKQVHAILDNLALTQDLLIEEIYITNPVWLELFLYLLKIKPKQDSIPDIIIGAGSKTTIPMLRNKIDSKTKVISVMKPQFFESKFDLIVAPRHDYKVVPDNVFTYIGSIAKVNINPELEDIGLIVVGGLNKHFNFDEAYLISQVDFVISLFPDTNWIVFNSRRTPKSFNKKIKKNTSIEKFIDVTKNFEPLDDYLPKAKFKFVTPDSVNMIFESLSSSGETYLFDMHSPRENKITQLIDEVKNNKYVGYLEEKYLKNSEIKTISLNNPNTLHDTFREVEKVVYEIEKRFIK
jgi:mitochondrial fission protein ELM1